MGRVHIRLFLLGLGVLALAMLITAPRVDAMRVKVGGRVYGIMPGPGALAAAQRRAGSAPRAPAFIGSGGNVQYNGGDVLHTSRPYLIFWQPTSGVTTPISGPSQALMERYLSDVSADPGETDDTYGVGRQYYDAAGIADAGQSFTGGQMVVDTDPYVTPSDPCSITVSGFTACVTDTQIEQELNTLIGSGLPTDGPASEQELPANAPIYFVVLPQSTDECFTDAQGTSCIDSGPEQFCAYHTSYYDGSNNVIYAVVPFGVYNGGAKGCQQDGTTPVQEPNSDPADTIIDNLSHEDNEAITDPLGDAWYSDTTGAEIADNCETFASTPNPAAGDSPNAYEPTLGGSAPGGTLYDQLINGHQYYTQSLWSNAQGGCELHPTSATLTPAFTVTGAHPGQGATIDPTSTVSAAGAASATWNWGDGTTSFVPGSLSTTTHSFPATGFYTVKLSVVDGNGNVASVSKQVAVGNDPSAVIGTLPAATTVGAAVSFSGSSSTDPNRWAITNFDWDFGDHRTATGVTARHSYAKPGIYTVTLGVNDAYGFAASTAKKLDVLAIAKVDGVGATHHGTTADVLVKVTQPGTIVYARHSTKVGRPGTVKIKLKLTAEQVLMLRHGHRFTLAVALVYRPKLGRPITERKRLTL